LKAVMSDFEKISSSSFINDKQKSDVKPEEVEYV